MTSAVLDEDQIMIGLSVGMTEAALTPVRIASLCSIIDAWDRKALRVPFVELTGDAINLSNCASRLEILYNVARLMQEGKFDQEYVANTIKDVLQRAEGFKAGLTHKMVNLVQCPEDDDLIN